MPEKAEGGVSLCNRREAKFTGGHTMEYAVLDSKKTGERIKELRKKCHLTVEQLSHHMGFESVQAIYKWQRGESLPTIDNLYVLGKVLHTPVDDILRGSREEEQSSSRL